ncbi:MAG: UDP-galactopyranose mutase, partial [Methylocystaceae bacterium]
INYPNDYDFTRITEYKYLTGQKHQMTTLSREYPRAEGDPYYPIPTPKNQQLYLKYALEAEKLANVSFIGRLAEYRYYSMDQVITRVFNWLRDKSVGL